MLRVGDDSHLSFAAAAALCEIRGWGGGRIDVTCPRRVRVERPIRAHRTELPADEVMIRDGIPTTGPARTQFDLGSVLAVDALFSVVNRAEVNQVADRLSLPDLLDRYPRHGGNATVREVLGLLPPGGVRTQSPLEDRFYLFCRRHGIPVEGVNVEVETEARPYRSDFVWERARLIIETDGGRFHSGPIAQSRDVERDRNLRRAGWELVRLTDEHLDDAEAESRRGGAPGLAEWIIRRIGLAGPPRGSTLAGHAPA
ncbi:MAG: endonuclease domain-containing protein [Solirubrobacterales bacterium]